MNIFKLTIAISLFLFSMTSWAHNSSKTILVINNGKTVATIELAASTKIEVSAHKQETNADKTEAKFIGKARLLLISSSGEVASINADEFDITSRNKRATSWGN